MSRKRGVINTFGLLEDLAGALEPGPARDRYRTVVRLLDWYAKHHREAPGNLGELERDVSLIRGFARPLPGRAGEPQRDYFGLARELAIFRDLRFARDVEARSADKIRAGFVRFLRGIADHPDAAGSPETVQGGVPNLDPRLVNTPLLVLAYAIERMPASPEQDSVETAKRVTPFRLPGWRPAPGRRTLGDAPHWLAGRPEPARRRHRPACPARRRHDPAPPFRLPFAAGSRRFRHIAIPGYSSEFLLNSDMIHDRPLA